jgi:hypothetical protein
MCAQSYPLCILSLKSILVEQSLNTMLILAHVQTLVPHRGPGGSDADVVFPTARGVRRVFTFAAAALDRVLVLPVRKTKRRESTEQVQYFKKCESSSNARCFSHPSCRTPLCSMRRQMNWRLFCRHQTSTTRVLQQMLQIAILRWLLRLQRAVKQTMSATRI